MRGVTSEIDPVAKSSPSTTRPVTAPALPKLKAPPRRGLSMQEWRRRAVHFFPGLLAFGMTQVPHRDPITLYALTIGTVFGLGLVIWSSLRFHEHYRRHPEEGKLLATLGYGIPLIVLLFLFRGHLEIGLAAAAIIAFGDGSATLSGLLLRGPRLPWNTGKTCVGTFFFMAIGTLTASLVYWLEARPHVEYSQAVMIAAPVAVCCALLESLRWRINDNVIVSTSAAVLMIVMQSVIIGW